MDEVGVEAPASFPEPFAVLQRLHLTPHFGGGELLPQPEYCLAQLKRSRQGPNPGSSYCISLKSVSLLRTDGHSEVKKRGCVRGELLEF